MVTSLLQTLIMNSNRRVQEFVPLENSARALFEEIYGRSKRDVQRNVEFARMQRKLAAVSSKNAVLKKAK